MQNFFYTTKLNFRDSSVFMYSSLQYGDNIYHLDHVVTAPFKFGIKYNKKKKENKKHDRRTLFYRIKTPQGNIDNISLDQLANIKYSTKTFYN